MDEIHNMTVVLIERRNRYKSNDGHKRSLLLMYHPVQVNI